MATVGKITAVLTARTAGFRKSMKRAGRTISDVTKKVVKFGAVMVAAAAVGLAAIVRRQLKLIDSLGKMSRALGIAVVELQALRLAGQLGGIEIDKMDKALKRIVKSVSDANRGLSTAKDAFEALGINAEDLRDLNADEIFKRLADAVQKAGVNVKTLGALMDLFGARVGAELINVLLRGRQALDDIKQEVKDLGLEMSNIDTIQIEEANDAWTRLKALVEGVANKLTLAVSQLIPHFIDQFVEWGKAGVKAGNDINAVIAKTIAIIGVGAEAVKAWTVLWQFLELNAASMVETMFRASVAVNKFFRLTEGAKDAALSLAGAIQATAEAQERFDKSFRLLGTDDVVNRISDAYRKIVAAARESAEAAAELAEELAKAVKETQGLDDIKKKLEALGERFTKATRTPLEKFKKTIEQLKELLAGEFITREVFDRAVKAAQDAVDRATPKVVSKVEQENRTGQFGSGNLKRISLKNVATPGDKAVERANKVRDKILEGIRNRLDNPVPIVLAFK